MKLNKSQKLIYDWLLEHKGYINCNHTKIYQYLPESIAKKLKSWLSDIGVATREARKTLKDKGKLILTTDTYDKAVVWAPETVLKKPVKITVKASNKISEVKAEELIEKIESKPEIKPKFKRLFFDIETSPNVVFSWNVGYKLNIPPDNILKERAVICICWKWEGESKVHELHWDNGDDKELLTKFSFILNSADEIIGHNSDNYDVKWVRTRCIYHGIPMFPDYTQIDTLKLAKAGFRFNSNKLDYIGGFLGVGNKMDTGGFSLWKSIILDNDEKAMAKMIKYCKVDVIRLQQIYNKLNVYSKHKTHVGVLMGKNKCSCPNCGSNNYYHQGKVISALGTIKHRMQCKDCHKYYRVSHTEYKKSF